MKKNDGSMPKNVQENTNERSLATTPTNNIIVEWEYGRQIYEKNVFLKNITIRSLHFFSCFETLEQQSSRGVL